MPIVTSTFDPIANRNRKSGSARTHTRPEPQPPTAILKQLHDELAAAGLAVDTKEAGATPRFGLATSSRLKELQQRFRLQPDAKLTPEAGGILSLAAAVATETDRAKLRVELNGAVNAVLHSPQYNARLARCALIAGDYAFAARIWPHCLNDDVPSRGPSLCPRQET